MTYRIWKKISVSLFYGYALQEHDPLYMQVFRIRIRIFAIFSITGRNFIKFNVDIKKVKTYTGMTLFFYGHKHVQGIRTDIFYWPLWSGSVIQSYRSAYRISKKYLPGTDPEYWFVNSYPNLKHSVLLSEQNEGQSWYVERAPKWKLGKIEGLVVSLCRCGSGASVQCVHSSLVLIQPVLRIHDILGWIRIRGSMPLTSGSGSGSGSCYFRHLTFKIPAKN